MKHLQDVLKKEDYKKIRFKVSKTQHLLIKATINGVSGNFILDTGASNSCMGIESIEKFHLTAIHSKTKAASAGSHGMETQIAKKNKIKIGRWTYPKIDLVLFDMSFVNHALKEHKAPTVDGIIGADILLIGKAIIDYYNHCLYLQEVVF